MWNARMPQESFLSFLWTFFSIWMFFSPVEKLEKKDFGGERFWPFLLFSSEFISRYTYKWLSENKNSTSRMLSAVPTNPCLYGDPEVNAIPKETNPGGSRSSEIFFNRNSERLKLSKLSDNTNPRGLKLSDVFF